MLPELVKKIKIHFLIPVVLGLAYLGVVAAYSPWPESSYFGVLRIVEIILVSLLVARLIGKKRLALSGVVVVAISVITTAGLAAWQFYVQHSIGGIWYWLGERSFSILTPGIANANIAGGLVLRPYSTFPHPNVLAGYCVIMVTYMLYFSPGSSNKYYTQLVRLAVLCGISATIISLSRTALVVLVLVLFVWLVQKLTKRLRQVVGVLLAAALMGGLLFASGGFARFSTLKISDEAVVIREYLIGQALQMTSHNLWTGVGVSNFLPTLGKTIDPLLPFRDLQPVHSLYLLVLAETGLVGLGIFVLILLTLFFRIWRDNSNRLGKFIILAALLFLGLTDHYLYTLHQGQLLLAFVIGVVFAAFPKGAFTVAEAKNVGIDKERKEVKKTISSSSMKISRMRKVRRKKNKATKR